MGDLPHFEIHPNCWLCSCMCVYIHICTYILHTDSNVLIININIKYIYIYMYTLYICMCIFLYVEMYIHTYIYMLHHIKWHYHLFAFWLLCLLVQALDLPYIWSLAPQVLWRISRPGSQRLWHSSQWWRWPDNMVYIYILLL